MLIGHINHEDKQKYRFENKKSQTLRNQNKTNTNKVMRLPFALTITSNILLKKQ